jgi:hypothetical protein
VLPPARAVQRLQTIAVAAVGLDALLSCHNLMAASGVYFGVPKWANVCRDGNEKKSHSSIQTPHPGMETGVGSF